MRFSTGLVRSLVAAWLSIAACMYSLADTPPASEGFSYVKSAAGISEYTLESNGLTVLLLPDHSMPVAMAMMTFRVGSRNEVIGTTGATHLLEHLFFKGTAKYNRQSGTSLDLLLDKVGAVNNATTWFDHTNYFVNTPSEHLLLVLDILADHMRYLRLREEDRQPEMTVVRNEFEIGENSPAEALEKEVWATAYLAHPYHHPTIGWRSDIESVPIEKLRGFYDTFYWPNNATVTVVGDFDPSATLAHIKQAFGVHSSAPHKIPEVYTTEPAQTGPRRVVVKRPGEIGVVQISHKAPAALDPNSIPLTVLSSILTDGKTSRLYRALVDTGLAAEVSGTLSQLRDPGLFSVTALLAPGVAHDQVEKVLRAELDRAAAEGVTNEELARAQHQIAAQVAYARDGVQAIAAQLNEWIAVGDWTLYDSYLAKIRAVTAADVQTAAKEFLRADQSTTGWYVPVVEGGAGDKVGSGKRKAEKTPWGGVQFYSSPKFTENSGPDVRNAQGEREASLNVMPRRSRAEAGQPSGSNASSAIAPRVVRKQIAGIDVIALPTSLKDVVSIRGSLAAGNVFSPSDNPMIADLTAQLLDKGTTAHTKLQLAELLENLGASIEFDADTVALRFSVRCLKTDVLTVITLLAEQLRSPAFSPEEIDKAKKQRAGSLREEMQEPQNVAAVTFSQKLFPPGHPNRATTYETRLSALDKIMREDLVAYHKKYYGPKSMRLVAVGDIDPGQIGTAIEQSFSGWNGGVEYPKFADTTASVSPGVVEGIPMAEKPSVTLLIGQPSGLRANDPDYLALQLATHVLGSDAFSARLLAQVRDVEGLSYGIGARLNGDTFCDGMWRVRGSFAPALLKKGEVSTQRELEKWYNEGVIAQELAINKTNLKGLFSLALATSQGLAESLLTFAERGLGPEDIDSFPARVDALTLDQVNAAIKHYLDPSQMVTVEAGTLPDK